MKSSVNAQIEQDTNGYTVYFDIDGRNVAGVGPFKTAAEAYAAVRGFEKALALVDDMSPRFRLGSVD